MTFATVYVFIHFKVWDRGNRDKRPRDDLIAITVNNVLLNFRNNKKKKTLILFRKLDSTIQFYSLIF